MSDSTMDNDPTYENYLALLGAILIDESHENYKSIVYNKRLFNKEEERRRIKEIDELRARGGKTELEEWYRNSVSLKQRQKNERVKRILKKIAKQKQQAKEQEKNRILEKFKEHLVDVESMDLEEILKYKIKVINIKTDEIKICTREECHNLTGIEKKSITTYMKKRRTYKSTYLYTLSNEELSKEEAKKVKSNAIRLKITNIETGEEKILNNFREASTFFGMNYITFQQYFRYKNMTEVKGWKIEELYKKDK